jgi:Ca-activated chloride channel family protein
MTNPTLIFTPRRDALLAGHDNSLDVLVRVQVPDAPTVGAVKRSPLHLALVIDRSGSMSGQPLEEAKRCAAHVIDGLQPTDCASIVVYDNEVQTLVPALALDDRAKFHDALRGLGSGGSTDLHAGWLRGAETLAPLTGAGTLSRVILLSDGCANHGLTDVSAIARQCAELAGAGVSTSTYGLGHHFNEELMVAMARAGGGNHYYGQTAEDLMDPFREEFALLNATCARATKLTLTPAAGVRLEVINDYVAAGDATWSLPDLVHGGEVWAMVRLHIPKSLLPAGHNQMFDSLLTASVRYNDMTGEPRAIQPATLALRTLSAAAFGAVAEDELVTRRASELEAAAIQRKARAAAQEGDWDTVMALLARIEKLGENNEWLRAVLMELRILATQRDRVMFAKEAMYSSERMSRRVAASEELPCLVADAGGAAFLRRRAAQGKRDPSGPAGR